MNRLFLSLIFLSSIAHADIFGNGSTSGTSSSGGGGSGATVAVAAQNSITKYTASGSSNTLGGDTTLSSDGTTFSSNENIFINNALGGLYVTNVQANTSGINLQSTVTSGTGFAGGLFGFNLGWNVALSSYIVSNDFGTDYFGMMVERGGDVAFSGSNAVASNTFLTHAQIMANNKLYIKGTTGLVGINMGATIPSLAGFQVAGSTTVAFAMGISTSAAGPFNFYVSTQGAVGYEDRTSSGTLSSCGTGPSFIGGPNALTITGGTGSTGCTYTFPVGFFTKTPICIASPEAFSITNAFSYSTTATAVTTTETGLGTGKVDIVCTGRD